MKFLINSYSVNLTKKPFRLTPEMVNDIIYQNSVGGWDKKILKTNRQPAEKLFLNLNIFCFYFFHKFLLLVAYFLLFFVQNIFKNLIILNVNDIEIIKN